MTGTDPVVAERPGPAELTGTGCAFVSLVPTQLRRMLDAGAGLAAFRAILVGGAAVPGSLLADARAAGAQVVTTYGMSETCGGCVYDGMPLDGVSVRTGVGGQIRIGGPVVFSGYRNRPDLTAAALDDGWFVTSDVGELAGDGRLTVHGRADEMINTGGEKVGAGRGRGDPGGMPGGARGSSVRRARPAVGGTGDRGCGAHRPGSSPEPG